MKKMKTFSYAKCKESKNPVIQILGLDYVIFAKCASCGRKIFPLNRLTENFGDHFELFEITDRWYDGIYDDHIRKIEANPDNYRVKLVRE